MAPVILITPVTEPVALILLPIRGKNGSTSTSRTAICKSASPSKSTVPPAAIRPSSTGNFKVRILNLRFSKLASIFASPTTLLSMDTSFIEPTTLILGLS